MIISGLCGTWYVVYAIFRPAVWRILVTTGVSLPMYVNFAHCWHNGTVLLL
jgi:hypothetical protein